MSTANGDTSGRKRAERKDGGRDPTANTANTPDSPAGAGGNIAPASQEAANTAPTTSDPAASFKADTEAPDNPAVHDDEEQLIPAVSAPRRQPLAAKGLIAVVLLASSLVGFSVLAIHRFSGSLGKSEADDHRTSRDKPAAASAEPRRLDLSVPAVPAVDEATGSTSPSGQKIARSHRVPALVPTSEEMSGPSSESMVEPIGVRRTSAAEPSGAANRSMRPEDAPVILVSTKPTEFAPPGALPRAAAPSRFTPAGPQGGGQHRAPDIEPHRESPSEPLDPVQATERNLEIYQRRLQGLLDRLTQASDLASPQSTTTDMARTEATAAADPMAAAQSATAPTSPTGTRRTGQAQNRQSLSSHGPTAPGLHGSLSGDQLPVGHLLSAQWPASATPKATATMLGHRSLTLPKGSSFTCALKSRIVTASAGLVGCLVQRNVYSDDGRVLLIERGSHLDGEYRVTGVRPGTVRIPVLWTRVRTPHGVVVDLDSPATGPLGESGIEGHVDNRWSERLGAAMLLSLIDDSVKIIASHQSEQSQGGTVVLPSTTSGTSKLAEKVLDSTINIPPLIYQNQGGIAAIYVARDVDFSTVYTLVPTTVGPVGR
jgi:type IV secretion system protein VirB10